MSCFLPRKIASKKHTSLSHTPSFTRNFVTHIHIHSYIHTYVRMYIQTYVRTYMHTIFSHTFTHSLSPPPLSFLPSPTPLQPLKLIIGRSWLVGLSGPLICYTCKRTTTRKDNFFWWTSKDWPWKEGNWKIVLFWDAKIDYLLVSMLLFFIQMIRNN